MRYFAEEISNPNQEFWILKEKNGNKSPGRIFPKAVSNMSSGKTVAVFRIDTNGQKVQDAQLSLPDYNKLRSAFQNGEEIDLSYMYVDDFSWLDNRKPYEVEDLPYIHRRKVVASCSFWNGNCEDTKDRAHVQLIQSEIENGNIDFSYSVFCSIDLVLDNLKVNHGNIDFSAAHFFNVDIAFGGIECGGDDYFRPEISFRYIRANKLKVNTLLLTHKLNIDFLDAMTKDSEVLLGKH